MVAQEAHLLCDLVRDRQHSAGIAVRPQVLAGIEAGGGDVSGGSGGDATTRCALGLSGVLDHLDTDVSGDLSKGPDRSHLAVQVDRHHRARAVGDAIGDARRVEQERVVVDVGEHGNSTEAPHRSSAGDEGVRRHDDLVPRLQPEGTKRELDRVGSTAHADAVPHAAEVGVGALKRADLLPTDERGAGEHPLPPFAHRLLHSGVLRLQVNQRNMHRCAHPPKGLPCLWTSNSCRQTALR